MINTQVQILIMEKIITGRPKTSSGTSIGPAKLVGFLVIKPDKSMDFTKKKKGKTINIIPYKYIVSHKESFLAGFH